MQGLHPSSIHTWGPWSCTTFLWDSHTASRSSPLSAPRTARPRRTEGRKERGHPQNPTQRPNMLLDASWEQHGWNDIWKVEGRWTVAFCRRGEAYGWKPAELLLQRRRLLVLQLLQNFLQSFDLRKEQSDLTGCDTSETKLYRDIDHIIWHRL